ncbi:MULTISPECIES: sensor histidine kinase [Streptomyces]|uniref:histidine kinase n=1 Tax=Streptomyces spororaveus TaxID=284039 RepID=A0ABQ3TDC1_9ACTN|nr:MULTISPECIES: sensor histidine kinase [Streptomyces]MCM9081196.1 sensor domain-containing protein [Streptomyces spororaveus]MCX5304357.1 sensor domain-containing protein [Streptomyces sp. NBC_00160]GHI78409.1 histidine kinase [Streptomyces spororaveus]
MTMSHAVPDNDRPPPVRAVFSAVTWKEIAYLVSNLPLAIVGFVYAVVMVSTAGGLSVTAVGIPLLACGLYLSRQLGRLDRARARGLLGVRVDEPTPIPGPKRSGGFFPWLWTSIKDPVGWRTVLYQLIRLPWGVLTFTVALTGLFVLWPVLPYLVRLMANVDRAMVRGLLSPSEDLERRIAELESDRGVVVDTAAADLRRIERDLHDGAQARLVALAMGLGLAKEKLLEDPEGAAAMVDEAHGEVKLALQELRDLARGIHPAVLTDRGLDAALSSVAARCVVPVKVAVDLPGDPSGAQTGAQTGARPAEAIEGIAYFVVSELLQNVSKHAGPGARGASVEVWRAGARLMIRVSDDGQGGASPSGGSGLAGLAERLGAVDGVLVVDSPVGVGTVVTAELPWRDRG